MIDPSATLAEFLEAAAAKTPAPGGGAVAAVAGTLAAAMGEMVLNYSVAKKDLLQFAETNNEALHELTKARAVLIELMREDQAAFEALTAAKKSGGDVAACVRTAIGVPQSIGATAVAILRIATSITDTSNRWLLSDLAVCGELATATVRCAVHNVRANFPDLQDEGAKNTLDGECREMVRRAVSLVNELMGKIEARTSAV